jgi:hypothetical protein
MFWNTFVMKMVKSHIFTNCFQFLDVFPWLEVNWDDFFIAKLHNNWHAPLEALESMCLEPILWSFVWIDNQMQARVSLVQGPKYYARHKDEQCISKSKLYFKCFISKNSENWFSNQKMAQTLLLDFIFLPYLMKLESFINCVYLFQQNFQ